MIYRTRKCLSAVIHGIECCGRQGIPLRRHEDNGLLFNYDGSNVNHGNFKELIKNMPEFDSECKDYILLCKRNATDLSKSTKPDLLLYIKEYVKQEIASEIKDQNKGPFFGLFANEVTDGSTCKWGDLGQLYTIPS